MTALTGLTIQLPLVGEVVDKDALSQWFRVRVRSGTDFTVHLRETTWFDTVTNLDRLSRQRLPLEFRLEKPVGQWPRALESSVKVGDLIAVEGIYYAFGEDTRYEAMAVHLLKSFAGYYLFEHTHWWKGQMEAMANKWLDALFGEKRTYAHDDFAALYRTTLSIEGAPTGDATQEMATLSRLIYGLSSAYLLGGDERYFEAARAGVRYQREAFRSYSTDGRFCFWLHARLRDRHGVYDVLPSLFADDAGTIPLYEQIYALAGLAQYYRITNDWETLQDIRRTLDMFEAIFADRRSGAHDGFFSHIDPVTFRWDSPELAPPGGANNRARKNWNSIGDHLPAYLINLVLALDPLPQIDDAAHRETLAAIRDQAIEILEVTAGLIRDKFPQPGNNYVQERFTRDWQPVTDWQWQQNRAVVGHNLKIAWNLTRVANYYRAKGDERRANQLFALARDIGEKMARVGIDQVRSGVYDVQEREPHNHLPVQFAWWNTKDFWQQEQGILAYLIMAGHARDAEGSGETAARNRQTAASFGTLARELSAVWNLYFLDRERNGIFFRVSDNGIPVLSSTYGDKGGHSISGYHAFELNYLAHIYQLAYLPRQQQQHTAFCLHFRPSPESRLRSINVLPDFLGPDAVEVAMVEIDGVPRTIAPGAFQIPIGPDDLGRHMVVRFRQTMVAHARRQSDGEVRDDRWFAEVLGAPA
jgi:mannose/cellobiose epimerase-like protein (N-acyl-D-glucosamine 2-epimerase family)